MSLPGHLIPRIASSGEEPAATQALAYLLYRSTDIATAFVDAMGRTGIRPLDRAPPNTGTTVQISRSANKDGLVRILVENKYWAGLTDAQPLAYLDALPSDAAPAVETRELASPTSSWRGPGAIRSRRSAAPTTFTLQGRCDDAGLARSHTESRTTELPITVAG